MTPIKITREQANELIKEQAQKEHAPVTMAYNGQWWDIRGMTQDEIKHFAASLVGKDPEDLKEVGIKVGYEKNVAFDITDRGFNIKAVYGEDGDQYAQITCSRNGVPFKEMKYPAYRIWNLAAHFSEYVDEWLKPKV